MNLLVPLLQVLIVCGTSELLQSMMGDWVVVGPTHGELLIECTLYHWCLMVKVTSYIAS